jgi:hypothetical protein
LRELLRIGFGAEGSEEESERIGCGGGWWLRAVEEGGGNPSNKSSAISPFFADSSPIRNQKVK